MAQVINTNVASLFAGAALQKSAVALQTAQNRLASGLRINSAKDDATGLVSATNFDISRRAAATNQRAAEDALSVAQTADGLLGIMSDNLLRIGEIGASSTEGVALAAENARLAALVSATPGTASNGGVTVTGATIATNATIGTVNTSRAAFGADMAALQSAINSFAIQQVNLSASYSRVMDADYAAETTSMTRNNILQQAGMAVLAQANQTPNTVLTLLR
jgi:flagellin